MAAQAESLLALILFLPLAGAVINGLVGRRLGKKAIAAVGISTVATAFILTVVCWMKLRDGVSADPHAHLRASLWTWIDSGTVKIQFSLMMDQLSAVMALVVTGVGSLIHLFSVGYMQEDPSYHRYFAYLNLFMFSMLALVLGSNLLIMFLGWEGVGLCSYLLIGFWFTDDQKAQAGQKAFVVNRIGDFGFLVGLFMLMFYSSGNTEFTHLASLFSDSAMAAGTAPLRDPLTITLICLFLFVGATGKSAQIPLYVWLPDAMAGPTPVSALIHAATMVTAGIYMITRMNFLYTLSPMAMATIATIGAATALVAATMGILQRDIKKVLAYSTVSQLGFMFLAVGVGAYSAAVFHLMTHAFFKACLFLGSGAIIHAMHHEQDIFKMGNLRAKLPVVHITFLLATMAIAGVPGLAGFASKEAILHGSAGLVLTSDASLLTPWGLAGSAGGFHAYFQILTVVGLLAAFCTAFYMFRLYFLTFWGSFRGDHHTWDHVHTPGMAMRLPLVVLALLSVGGGYIALDGWLAPLLERPLAWFEADHAGFLAHNLMPISIAVAAVAIGLAWFLYAGPGKALPAKLAASMGGLYDLVFNKYYVDEIYDAVVVRFLRGSAQVLFRAVDRVVIDTLGVRGVPWFLMTTGRIIRFGQNGDVQRYAAVMVLGLAALIYFI